MSGAISSSNEDRERTIAVLLVLLENQRLINEQNEVLNPGNFRRFHRPTFQHREVVLAIDSVYIGRGQFEDVNWQKEGL